MHHFNIKRVLLLKLALCLYVCTVSVNAFGISSPSLKNHFSGINVDFHLGDTQTLAQLYWLVSYLESLRQLSGLYFRKFSLAIYNVYFGQWYDELINSGKWKGTVLRLDRKKKKKKQEKKCSRRQGEPPQAYETMWIQQAEVIAFPLQLSF